MDPDDVVRERGVDTVHELLDSPKPLLEFLLLDIPTEPSRRRRAGLRLAPLVCSASDAAVRQNLVEELARHLYLRPREVEEAGRQPRRSQAAAQSTVRAPVPPGERELVRILLECSGEWRRRILELVHRDLFEDERVRKVLEEAGAVLKSDSEQADFVGELMQRCTDSDAANLVAELGNSKMPEITDETIRLQLQTIVQRQAQERSLRLAPLIAAAEASGNSSELDRLLAEKARLRQYSVEF
jgi:DNA primase